MVRVQLLTVTSLCGLLAACGGGESGGVNSTPLPANTPPPSNTSLSNLQYNEDFANIAITGNASYPKSGGAPANAIANAPITVRYDAKSQGYTIISTTGRSQTFLPSDISSSLSNARIATYVKTSGSTTDSLTLTKPGTSGRNYQYVGGGYWQRTVNGDASITGSLDAFVYGVVTPGAAVPRTGRAEFAVDLLGAETTSSTVVGITGTGLTQVDFASGAVITHGTLAGTANTAALFSSEAKLSSSSNAFTGNFRFDDGGLFAGSLNGAFFGPQANEIGGAFSASATDGRIAVGTIVGRGANTSATNSSIAPVTQNAFFTNDAAQFKATSASNGSYAGSQESEASLLVNYDAARQKYTLVGDLGSQFFATPTLQQGSVTDRLTFVAPPGMQYVRGGEWRTIDIASGLPRYAVADFTYGVETSDSALPRVGTAGYATQISGTMADRHYSNLVGFSGNGTVIADFAGGKIHFDSLVQYVNESPIGFAAVANGRFLADATLSSNANLFSGTNATMDGIGSYFGSLDGRFYGPAANEIGAAFHLNDGTGGVATGLIVGQQDGTVLTPSTSISVTGTMIYPKSGGGTASSIASSPLAVRNDTLSQGYSIVSAAGRSQSFLPADINSGSSNARIATYTKTFGSTTDSLIITKPGTSGRNYQYAGAGYWQRVVDSASALSTSFDSFVFGAMTPDAAVPRTGRAEFAVDMQGAETTISTIVGITGTGLTQVDFASGAVITHGSFAGTVNGSALFSSEAKLSSNSNAFTGNFRFDDGGLFAGSLNGALFGPQANEIGGAFSASTTDGRIAVGTIVGRGASASATNTSLASPTQNEFFTNDGTVLKATLASSGTYSGSIESAAPLLVNYDATRQKYTVIADTRSQFFGTLTQQQGTSADSLTFVAPSGTQYVRGAEWRSITASAGGQSYAVNDFTYGVETPDGALPRAGTAGYATQISGTMADGHYSNLVSFSGNGTVTANFASGQIDFQSGVHYVSEAPAGFAAVGNGKFLARAALSNATNLFSSATATMDGIGSYSGSLDGRFYGPAANEIGAAFHLNNGSGGVATGLIVGQQDATVLAPLPSLATLSQLMTFDSSRYLLLGVGQPVTSTQSTLAYDPASQTYTFTTAGNGLLAAQAIFNSVSASDASFDTYNSATSSTGGVTGTAKIYKPASFGLTYTSFADISLAIVNGTTQTPQIYYPFGIDTPAAQLPQYGTGTYDGTIYGRGRTFNNLTQVANPFTLSGTSRLAVDFGKATFADTLNIIASDPASSATITAQGSMSALGAMTGNFGPTGTGVTGEYRGSFFGPHAAEYGAVFTYGRTVSATPPTATSNVTTSYNGVIVGKQSSFTP